MAARYDLFARRSDQDRVLHLGHVGAFHVAQGRVRLYKVVVHEVLQSSEVPRLAAVVKPPPAKSQRAEVLLDGREQQLRALDAQGDVRRVENLHVMRAFQILDDVALAAGREGLDGIKLASLHKCAFVVLGDRDGLPG